MPPFLYEIIPQPHTNPPNFNFKIWMDSKFAKKLLKRNISQKNHDWMQGWGKQVIYSCGLKDVKNEYLPYEFVREKDNLTYLLRNAKLPGNSEDDKNLCRLNFSSDGISEDVKDIKGREIYYHSRNIRSMEQSHILLMLWLEWFELWDFLPKK